MPAISPWSKQNAFIIYKYVQIIDKNQEFLIYKLTFFV